MVWGLPEERGVERRWWNERGGAKMAGSASLFLEGRSKGGGEILMGLEQTCIRVSQDTKASVPMCLDDPVA